MRSITFLRQSPSVTVVQNNIAYTPLANTPSIIIALSLTGVICESTSTSFLTFARATLIASPYTVSTAQARIDADVAYNPNINGTEISIVITMYTNTTNPSFSSGYSYLIDMPTIPIIGSSAYYN